MSDTDVIRKCEDCTYFRTNTPLDPFFHIKVWTPELLERKNKWDEDQRKLKQMERERFLANMDFSYEPLSYPWCAKWTETDGRHEVDPVAGPPRKIYVLCGYANADGHCKKFTPL
jgi:hypothetical protein